MRSMLATLLMAVLATPAVAQSDVARAAGAEFFGFKTYWVNKREGCQPFVSFNVRNASTQEIGPIEIRLQVIDQDKKSVFAIGSVSVASADLPPGKTKEVAVGGDHDIAPRDCLGDMHEAAFADIHLGIRLTATVGQDAGSVDILRDEPIKEQVVP